MPFLRSVAVLALLLPSITNAQGRNPQGRPGETRRMTIHEDVPPELHAKDLESLDPARIALDQRKALALTAAQTDRLDSIRRAYDQHAADLGKALDTLQDILNRSRHSAQQEIANRMMGSSRSSSERDSADRARADSIDRVKSDRERERTMAARNELGRILLGIRDGYDGYVTATNAALTDDQRARLRPFFDGASNELTTRLHWANTR